VLFPYNSQLEEKLRDAENVSFPKTVQVIDDCLHVTWQQRMQRIDFIGTQGKLLQTASDTDSAFYSIRPDDTYVRIKLTATDGLTYYLNPVIRYTGDTPIKQSLQRIDTSRTFLKRALIVLLVSVTLVGGGIMYVRAKRKGFNMKKFDSLWYCGLLFLIAIVLYLPNLGGPVLWDIDEARFATCSAELLRSGNWIVPQLNGEVYGTKPILMFWFMMLSYQIFGINEFAARFPSFVFALATLFLTYKIGSLFFSRKVGFWAAVALAVSLMFSIEARAATPDSPLTFFVALSLYVWACGTFQRCFTNEGSTLQLRVEGRYYPQELWRIVAIYLVMGVGVLMKGPLACVVPTAILGMFLLIKRLPPLGEHMGSSLPPPQGFIQKCGRYYYLVFRPFFPFHFLKTVWFMRPFTALLAIAVVALPWYLLAGWQTGWFTPGGYLYEFIYVNNFQRATQPFDGRDSFLYNPLFFYPLTLLVCFFPWSLFTIPAIGESVKQFRAKTAWNDGLLFLFCWALVWVGVFSVAVTKLPSYIVPMYPAFALLIGIYIAHWTEGKTLMASRWNNIAFGVGIGVGIALMTVGSLCTKILIADKEIFIPIILGLVVFIGCTYCFVSLKSKSPTATLAGFTLTAVLFTGFLHIVGVDRISTYHPAREIGAAVREHQAQTAGAPVRVVSFNCFQQSWVFYAGRPFERTGGTAKELQGLLDKDRPEIVLAPASLAEEITVPHGYRQQVFRDFKLPKRPQLIMFVRENSHGGS